MSFDQLTPAQQQQRGKRLRERQDSSVTVPAIPLRNASTSSTTGQTQQQAQAAGHVHRNKAQTANERSGQHVGEQQQGSKRKAPTQDDVVDLVSDGDDEDDIEIVEAPVAPIPQAPRRVRPRNRGPPQVVFRLPGKADRPMLKSSILQFYRNEASTIFHRQADVTVNNRHQEELNNSGRAIANDRTSKGDILQAYTRLWKPQLARARSAQKNELASKEPGLEKMTWDWEVEIYQPLILDRVVRKIQRVEEDIVKMEALIDFLRTNLE
jgi:hypothetical protein